MSVIYKVLEFLVLGRLQVLLVEAEIPHINQSAYRKNVSCIDALFATQVIAKYMRGGSRIHMCLYDLQKAFDSVEYSVLLDRMFEEGINGKTWRLLNSWYDGACCQVKCDGTLSEGYVVGRGIKQDSGQSPIFFLLVTDTLLKQLEVSSLGLLVNNFYAGEFLHVDDIKTLATSAEPVSAQVALVKSFTEDNFLKLNLKTARS